MRNRLRVRITERFVPSEELTAELLRREARRHTRALLEARGQLRLLVENHGITIHLAMLQRVMLSRYNDVRLEAVLGGNDHYVYIRTAEEFPVVLAEVEIEEEQT